MGTTTWQRRGAIPDFCRAGRSLSRREGHHRGDATDRGYSARMRYLHTMLRVRDLDAALRFFVDQLGLKLIRRRDHEAGRYTLVFLGTGAPGDPAQVELTYNWDQAEPYPTGRFFGHLAYEVDDIYATCARLRDQGVVIHRPPRDGRMAFVKSPDGHSVELLQAGEAKAPAEPWASMPNTGDW
jgi:lactoylglutathione lyase